MRKALYLVLAGALALGGTVAHGTGSISAIGATVDSGAAPSKGSVTVEECAPPVTTPTLPSIPAVDIGTQVQTTLINSRSSNKTPR